MLITLQNVLNKFNYKRILQYVYYCTSTLNKTLVSKDEL